MIFYSICSLRKMSRRRDNYLHQCQSICVHLRKIEHQSERGSQGSANQNLFPKVRARANKKSLAKVLERANEKRIHMFLTPALTLVYGNFICSQKFKDATQVNFYQKTALSTLRQAILTARHLFRPKNEVSKLFENLNFYTMFMC